MKRPAAGFSLLEVLVAFALLATALTMLMAALSQGTQQIRNSDDRDRARLHVQSLLAGLGGELPLQPGVSEGQWDDGHYQWQLRIQPWQSTPPAAPAGPSLLHVQVSVRWGPATSQYLEIDTLRLWFAGGAS